MSTNRDHVREVAERLALAIEATGYSQAAIARTLEISPTKLGNWLRGANYPDEYLMTRFCDRFGVTMDYLYRGLIYGLPSPMADGLAKVRRAKGELDQEAGVPPAREKRGRQRAA